MTSTNADILQGCIVECEQPLSLEDLGRLCATEVSCIVELVEEGILANEGGAPPVWRFGGDAVRRARVALRLQRDLEINLAGVALALELLDEIERLRRRLYAAQ